MWTENFQMYKLGLEKTEESEVKFPTFYGSYRKPGNSGKSTYHCFIDYAKAFDCVDHQSCGKFLKSWEYQTTLPVSWEICMWVKKQ